MKIRIKNPIWGIPITGLKYLWSDGTIHTEYNGTTTQFEIIDARAVALNDKQKNKSTYLIKDADGAINGKPTYARICIKKKDDLTPTPIQFEIIGLMSGAKDSSLINGNDGRAKFYINGKGVYARILIRKIMK